MKLIFDFFWKVLCTLILGETARGREMSKVPAMWEFKGNIIEVRQTAGFLVP